MMASIEKMMELRTRADAQVEDVARRPEDGQ
jgi:hypothetical protein